MSLPGFALAAVASAAKMAAEASGYDIILMVGQSNMIGTDATGSAAEDPRVFRYVHADCPLPELSSIRSTITVAADPLGHPDNFASGVGPGREFARLWADANPGRRVLLVPLARSNTPLVTTTPPTWNASVTGSLMDQAVTGANAAIAAAGPGSRIVAALCQQGETDAISGVTEANYEAAFVAFASALRSRITGASAMPFVLYTMVPTFNGSTHVQIRAVHNRAPSIIAPAAVAVGRDGYTSDNLHYNTAGMLVNTVTAFAAFQDLQASIPAPVSLWDHTRGVGGMSEASGAQYTIGTAITASAEGVVRAVWVYASAGMVGVTGQVGVYASTGAATPAATGSATLVLGWQKIALSTPVSVTSGQTFVAAFNPGQARFYGRTSGATWPLTSGVLTAPSGQNARYASGSSLANPSTLLTSGAYPVDVDFIPA